MKKLLIVVALLSVSNSCFAYNDYGYSYGVATPYSGGFDSSMHVREMENDFARQQALNAPSMAATVNSLGNSRQSSSQCQLRDSAATNSNRNYTVDRPLSLRGIGNYDGYGN